MLDETGIDRLKRRIRGTLRKERLTLVAAGLIGTAATLIAVSIILSLLAGIVILPVWPKVILLILSGAISLYIFWWICFRQLFSGSEETTAVRLEQKYPNLKGRLIAAVQFADSPDNRRQGYSGDLIKATLIQAEKESTGLEFDRIISAYPVFSNLKRLGIAAVLAVLLLAVFPGLFSYSYRVYSHPTELIAPPLGYQLTACPGDAVAVKYRDVDIGGILKGDQFPDEARIYFKFAGGTWQKAGINLKNYSPYRSASGDSLQFATTLKQVRRSIDYYVKAGRLTTPVAHIDVVDRPRVTGIKLSFFYPEYTGLEPTVIDENDGTISALFGTRVNMKIETNLPAATAEMVFDDSSRSRFEIDGNTGEQSFRIDKDRRYYIHLVDNQGEVNPNPIEYRITAIPDEYPIISVVRPGIDINLNEEMIVPLQLRISDDYGFTSLQLKYSLVSSGRRGDETVAVLHFSDRIKTEGEINFNWDVEPLHLMPSDYIVYYFELADNDMISGPKITKSREYIARLPSLEEIVAQSEREQAQTINRAEEFYRQHKELAERLKNIARKMEQDQAQMDQKLSWQHQKELEEITAEEENITEELKKTAENLDKMIDKMQENRVGNLDILEKLAEIQKLFEEVATPEMKEARLKLLEALKNMDPRKIEEALKDYQMSQEDLMERLDRTIALLQKMKIEQKVNAITEMAKQLADKQEQVNEKTSQTEKEKLPGLIPDEQEVKAGLENLKEQAAQLKKMLEETPYDKPNEAESFCQAVQNSDAGQDMENMKRDLQKSDRQEALQNGSQAYSKLMEMVSELQKGQASMCKGGGAEAARKMREAINDIKYLSDNQEELIKSASEMTGGSEVLRDIAAQQQVLKESVSCLGNRISELGRQSPFVAAELTGLMRQVIGNIELAINQLSNRRRLEAMNYQREALSNLNRAAVRMLDALESQSNCNNGSNCNKPTQMMQGLAQRQNQLNMQTQSQCQNQNESNSLNPEIMRRLASEQNAIKKSMQELQQEFGDSRDILGRMDAISKDMEKVADALAEGEVGQETMERQLKIYSRMLDATRTLQRKDFTEERRARVGEDILRNSPAALTGNHLEGGLDIEDRLRQFLDESYPEEYEQHIKAYFKALLENSTYYSPAGTNETE